MKSTYDMIVLSPHLDDAAFSCGGQIALKTAAGQSVLVVTIMAGDPPATAVSEFAQQLHDRWEMEHDAVAQRRQEDESACRILGADFLHWDIPDCIYRQHPQSGESLYFSDLELFGRFHTAEQYLIEVVKQRLVTLPRCEMLFAPLAIGNHVDHQITRLAAEQNGVQDLMYYEDYPYARDLDAVVSVIAADARRWHSKIVLLPEVAIGEKVDAAATYVSQISTFFSSKTDLDRQLRTFCSQIGGERYWYH